MAPRQRGGARRRGAEVRGRCRAEASHRATHPAHAGRGEPPAPGLTLRSLNSRVRREAHADGDREDDGNGDNASVHDCRFYAKPVPLE